MPVVGSRFLIEAGFIIAVAVVAGIERLSTWWIIAVVASAWIIVAIVEIVVWTKQVVAQQPQVVESAPPAFLPAEPVRVRVQPPLESRREPESTAEREPEPEPAPAPSSESPRIVAVPPPPPEPEAEPQPGPEAARVVAFLPASDGPREWNLWELERAARDHATDDVVRNEERSYLLMYLREFAGPDGVLPDDFDSLVRDSFGDLVGAR